jgi:DNA polymerase IIIc chi subunit
MKFSKDVTPEQIAGVLDWILEDMQKEREHAREAYEANKKDDFHMYMDTMFGLASDMIRGRMSTLCDDK